MLVSWLCYSTYIISVLQFVVSSFTVGFTLLKERKTSALDLFNGSYNYLPEVIITFLEVDTSLKSSQHQSGNNPSHTAMQCLLVIVKVKASELIKEKSSDVRNYFTKSPFSGCNNNDLLKMDEVIVRPALARGLYYVCLASARRKRETSLRTEWRLSTEARRPLKGSNPYNSAGIFWSLKRGELSFNPGQESLDNISSYGGRTGTITTEALRPPGTNPE